MSVPTVLTQASSGAPTLTGEDGSLIAVLDWALPQLGWTIPFTNTATKGVYRNDTVGGSGYYLRVLDAAADHAADARRAMVEAYSSMSDIDTGTDQFPTSSESYWVKSGTADTTTNNYLIIGNDKWFYFNRYVSDTSGGDAGFNIFGAGDLARLVPADIAPFFLLASKGTATSATTAIGALAFTGIVSSNSSTISAFPESISQSLDGTTIGGDGYGLVMGVPGALATFAPGGFGNYPAPHDRIDVSRFYVVDDIGGASNEFYRFSFPGLLVPLVDITPDVQSEWGDGSTVTGINNGNQVVSCRWVQYQAQLGINPTTDDGVFLFDTTSDWDDWE